MVIGFGKDEQPMMRSISAKSRMVAGDIEARFSLLEIKAYGFPVP